MKTTAPQTNNSIGIQLFPRIYKAFYKETQKKLTDWKNGLSLENDVNDILSKWVYLDLIPSSSKYRSWKNADELKKYLTIRKEKQFIKVISKKLDELNAIAKAPNLGSGRITIEWKKNKIWGNNPTAEAYLWNGESSENYTSGSIGGCGYDKESTAIAKALNQSNSLLKVLYLKKDKNITKSNHDLLGYGSGYGITPYLEGGVGTSCYPRIFESVGYKFKYIAHGKTFAQYEISK